MKLSDTIEGETQAEFERRVEAHYAYSFTAGERWCLFGDRLVVAHPERQPIFVHEDGRIEPIEFSAHG
jgi:hypothetical protein